MVHATLLFKRLGIDPERALLTFPTLGNIGPASLPYTLALTSPSLSAGTGAVAPLRRTGSTQKANNLLELKNPPELAENP